MGEYYLAVSFELLCICHRKVADVATINLEVLNALSIELVNAQEYAVCR